MRGDDESQAVCFQAVGDGQRSDGKRVGHDRRTGRAANGAEMGRNRRGGQVGTKMELRAQEDEREKQSQYADAPSVLSHVVNKMELREERLRGQALRGVWHRSCLAGR
jgi:hypothetical protein